MLQQDALPQAHLPQHVGRFLLSLPLSIGRGESGLSRACTFPSLSPGDAVLVLWRALPQETAKTIHLVLQCSRQIQKKHGSHETNVGQNVRLKIGTGAVPGAEPWHSPVPQGASHRQGMRGSLLGLVPKESISCKHSRGQLWSERGWETRTAGFARVCRCRGSLKAERVSDQVLGSWNVRFSRDVCRRELPFHFFQVGAALPPFPCWILPCLAQRAKGNGFADGCGKGFGRLLCFLKQRATTCLHVNGAGGDQACWFAGLLGRAGLLTPGTLNTFYF